MAYQQRSPLVIQRAGGSHDVLWSEAGVRLGDPMGPLLFALPYQPTLHAAQEHAADAIVFLLHIDVADGYLHNLNTSFHPGKPGVEPKVPRGNPRHGAVRGHQTRCRTF